ncbi:MAG: putative viral replication protein [Circoviridae sp.]|nr:MAG: putative viral replication protein [Circoviridae sp.]
MKSVAKTEKIPQVRHVCFTWNNYDCPSRIFEKLKEWSQVTFLIFGEEVGTKGTPHLQGYMEFKNSVKCTTLQNYLEKQHYEERMGPARKAMLYCKKGKQSKEEWELHGENGVNYGLEAKVWQYGHMSQQGKRNDIDTACEMIRSGKRMRDVALEHPVPYVKYHKGFQALKSVLLLPRDQVPEVRVYVGKTGSGKSKQAREWLCNDVYVWHPQQEKWFDGYEGQKEIIFEEFRGQIPFGMLLSLCDRYDCKVQYKGGMIEFVATKIAFTSPVEPQKWYGSLQMDEDDKIEQLTRRITEVIML